MPAIDDWKRGVLAVATSKGILNGSCFVIDAEKGLLWTAAHVLGEEPKKLVGQHRNIGMPVVDGGAIEWIYRAEILCSTGAQSHKPANNFDNVDGALLVIRHRLVSGTPHALTLPLLCADGKTKVIALPMKPDGLKKLQQVTLLGYPGPTQRFTPTHSHLSGPKTVSAEDGEYWMTDKVMLPGHSGGPVMNVSGEVIGWNVRDIHMDEKVVGTLHTAAGVKVTNEVAMSFAGGTTKWVPAKVSMRSGLNEIRPIRRVADLLQEWVAAGDLTEGLSPDLVQKGLPAAKDLTDWVAAKDLTEGFGPNILAELAAKPGCVHSPMRDEEKEHTAQLALEANELAEAAAEDAKLAKQVATEAGASAAQAVQAAAPIVQREEELREIEQTMGHVLKVAFLAKGITKEQKPHCRAVTRRIREIAKIVYDEMHAEEERSEVFDSEVLDFLEAESVIIVLEATKVLAEHMLIVARTQPEKLTGLKLTGLDDEVSICCVRVANELVIIGDLESTPAGRRNVERMRSLDLNAYRGLLPLLMESRAQNEAQASQIEALQLGQQQMMEQMKALLDTQPGPAYRSIGAIASIGPMGPESLLSAALTGPIEPSDISSLAPSDSASHHAEAIGKTWNRYPGVCAIGLQFQGSEPELFGSGFVVDGGRRLLCTCAYVVEQAEKISQRPRATGILDPAVHGFAVGFSQGVGQPPNWQGRAKLLWKVKAPPAGDEESASDLAVLQMTHHLDGSPLSESFALLSLPLGNSGSLNPGDTLTCVGFGVVKGFGAVTSNLGMRLRPTFGKLSCRREDASGQWLESLGMLALPGQGGSPVLGPKGDIIGWQVRVLGRLSELTEMRPIEELEPALAEVLAEPELRGSALRERLADEVQPVAASLGATMKPNVITLQTNGDLPTFDEVRFKKSLVGMLAADLDPSQVKIMPLKRQGSAPASASAINVVVDEKGYVEHRDAASSSEAYTAEAMEGDVKGAVESAVARWFKGDQSIAIESISVYMG